jgi:protein phosphatase
MTDDLLLPLSALLVVLVVVCIALVIALVQRRRKGAEPAKSVEPAEPALPQGLDVTVGATDDVDLTRVTAFLPSLAGNDEWGDDDDEQGSESKAILHFEGDSWMGVDEPTGTTPLIMTSSAARTDRGVVRHRNEDAFVADTELDLYVVADGMGGYAGGDIASKLAVDAVHKHLAAPEEEEVSEEPDYPRRGAQMKAAVLHANTVIYERARLQRDLEGMGTTLLAALFAPRKQRVYIGHVGDSRAYRLRDGVLQLLTTDHTLAGRGVTGPLATNIRRAVGIGPSVKVDVIIDTPQPNDTYLFCSDGLSKMVNENSIRKIVASEKDLDHAAEALVAAANKAGGRDNTTVIVVRVEEIVARLRRDRENVAHAR